ncbi:MAG: tRNA dihydrouridine synthase DusB [Bacilli bacterium]|nr:tRNA dihydrouridine synthase DusB [Bacilli bacterium]
MSFKIGDIIIKNNVVLAPMAGISNPTYIKICEEMGVGLAYTELISAEAIVRNNQKTLDMLNGIEDIHIPVGVQIFGSNAETMAKAAKILVEKYHILLIDINMGCPVPKVAVKNQAGSGLLKNPEKIREIVTAVVNAVNVPVTVKIRSGWDENSINAVQVAKVIEEAGAKAISVHGRTRKQGYTGKADWQIIKQVVEAVDIPVIGNGDIVSCYDAKRMLDETDCAAVMIGRGLLGNPWLIKEILSYLNDGVVLDVVSFTEKIAMMKKHLLELTKVKNEKVVILEMRSVLMYYLKGCPENKDVKLKICQSKTIIELLEIIDAYEKRLKNIEI